MPETKVEVGHTEKTHTPFIAVTLNGGTYTFTALGQTLEECLRLKIPTLDLEILKIEARLGELKARRKAVELGLQYLTTGAPNEH